MATQQTPPPQPAQQPPAVQQPQTGLQQVPTHSLRNWLVFMFFLFVIVTGMVWWYVSNTGSTTSNGNFGTTKKAAKVATDPTASWTPYTSTVMGVSLKYKPTWLKDDTCNQGKLLMLGPDKASLGVCGSDYVGEIVVSEEDGNHVTPLDSSGFSDITSSQVTINGVVWMRYSGTAKAQQGLGPLEGTKEVEYEVYHNASTYTMGYQQAPAGHNPSQDVLSDFELMVKTFKFTP